VLSDRQIVDANSGPDDARKGARRRHRKRRRARQGHGGDRALNGVPPKAVQQTASAETAPAADPGAKPGEPEVRDTRQAGVAVKEGERPAQRRRRRRGRRPRQGQDVPVYGALDLGTNNCRLLVARPAPGGFKVIDAFSRIVRLGEGVSRTGRLSEAAMDRTVEALKVCARKLAWRRVSRARLIATEACRAAENGAEFIARVHEETGLRLEIIDRETEAGLAVAGSASLIAPDSRSALVFDIGGGSTELMWLTVGERGYDIASWTSMPLGVVTLAERFGGFTVSPENFEGMVSTVTPLLTRFAETVPETAGDLPDHLLGTSGTVTTIAGVHLGLERYDRSRVDGCWLSAHNVTTVTEGLLALDYEGRASSPCIGHDRADLVLAGCAILAGIQTIWPERRIRVADRGLREGILTKLMQEDGTFGTGPGSRRRPATNGRGTQR